jgi:hypothetical protein
MRQRQTHLSRMASAELGSRVQRAFLVATVLGLVAIFALGASPLADVVGTSLLLSYAVFLGVFAIVLALALLRATGGQLGRALAVAEVGRAATEAEWREVAGIGIPTDPDVAKRWLEANPETDANRHQRLSAQVRCLDLAAARDTLTRYPRTTPFERYDAAIEEWFIEFIAGELPDPHPIEEIVATIEEPDLRSKADAGVATMRAHLAAARGGDWLAELAAPFHRIDTSSAQGIRAKLIVINWTVPMAIAAALVGLALLVGRLSGIFR